MEPFGAKGVVVSGEDLVDLLTVHQPDETLAAADVICDLAVGQPVDHGAVVHNVSAEQQLIVVVMEADAAPRVTRHVKHRQLSVTKVNNIEIGRAHV